MPGWSRFAFAAVFCALAILSATEPRTRLADAAAPDERTGDIIVRFKPASSLAGVAGALSAAEADARASTPASRLVLVRPRPGQSVDEALGALAADPNVEFVEADVAVHIAVTPNDTYYASNQWNLPQIQLPSAWDITTGSASVVVAVIDTGVDGSRPDLSGKLIAGYDFANGDADTSDDHGHGTFVAGIIGASTNNASGIAGVCWTCQIMPLKALGSTGSGSLFAVAQAIDYAVANGADVINMSLGGSTGTVALQTAVDNAWNAGVIVVAATGNDNGPVLFPAAYTNAIAVGANDSAGNRASFSNYGPEIDVMAPGESVIGTLCLCNGNPGSYGIGSGTSFAAPHVAGVVGLLIASGITDKTAIRSRLESTATDGGAAGFDNDYGWGRVNAFAAMRQYGVTWGANSAASSMAPNTTYPVTVSFTNTGGLTWLATGTNKVQFSYHWKNGVCPGSGTAVWDGLRTALASDVAPGGTVSSLNASVRAPASAGSYCLVYDLVREGVTWFSSQGASTQTFGVTVTQPVYGVSWGSDTTPASAAMNSNLSPSITFTNSGSLTWASTGANRVNLSYHWRTGACGGTSTAVWDGLRTALPADVANGASVTNLTTSVRTPASAGTYCLVYDLVREGVTWFSSQGALTKTKTVTITQPVYGITWGAHTTPSVMAANSYNAVTVSFTNAGTLTWSSGGANPVRLAYHWRNGACAGTSTAVWDGLRTNLTADVAAGGSVSSLPGTVRAPAAPGTYCLVYDLVREGVTWFSSQGAATTTQTVTVS